ncbi:uncharacterized protein LOC106704199 [Latimeria chalumnae]|uniref:uncharacterized protein LOC106704199 n=1 Tax=Latimeria chalumnae TaxID=7897 RepID=UPI0006D8FC4D|nr:PREDICTED: uncharacterized protein LOC106704199 [Latimeria chalumnae]|eukprot:XP_014346146.1 PREDICTED: uncharacterized protein LOC106704199 [Latimeria chalumnae]
MAFPGLSYLLHLLSFLSYVNHTTKPAHPAWATVVFDLSPEALAAINQRRPADLCLPPPLSSVCLRKETMANIQEWLYLHLLFLGFPALVLLLFSLRIFWARRKKHSLQDEDQLEMSSSPPDISESDLEEAFMVLDLEAQALLKTQTAPDVDTSDCEAREASDVEANPWGQVDTDSEALDTEVVSVQLELAAQKLDHLAERTHQTRAACKHSWCGSRKSSRQRSKPNSTIPFLVLCGCGESLPHNRNAHKFV